MAHARSVKVCLELIYYIEEQDEIALDEIISNFPAPPFGLGWRTNHLDFRADYDHYRKFHPAPNAIDHAHSIVDRIINPNISGVSRQFSHRHSRTQSRSTWVFNGMIEAVYWQLADKFEHGGIRRCRNCERTFVARDKRQHFCPPPDGLKRSRCASRHNVALHRDRTRGDK